MNELIAITAAVTSLAAIVFGPYYTMMLFYKVSKFSYDKDEAPIHWLGCLIILTLLGAVIAIGFGIYGAVLKAL